MSKDQGKKRVTVDKQTLALVIVEPDGPTSLAGVELPGRVLGGSNDGENEGQNSLGHNNL